MVVWGRSCSLTPLLYKQSTFTVQTLDNCAACWQSLHSTYTNPRHKEGSMKRLNAAAAILTIVGGLNWGLVGLFKFDLVAAVFGGMHFGEVNVASRLVYTLVGLSAAYLASQLRTLIRGSEPAHARSVTA